MKALSLSGGVTCAVLRERMTRAPVVQFDTLRRCVDLCQWLAVDINFNLIKASFESTSRFARLLDVDVTVAGRQAYLRFGIETGDAMGMNMVSKGTERALATLSEQFTDMHVVSLSGNLCSDKKATAVNWVKGRGRSVVCEAVLDSSVVQTVLKTTVEALVHLNVSKNLVGALSFYVLSGIDLQQ
ncbi:hydroxymethylglutaryl-coenzyme A reductase [Sphaeroforma arctica JP610]|uniref:hydroxymethylglutaryl-CoA reductase (NADPH) n=1 Tax=Sphaeroforma arctica JP610 TaxID=667725 RepID=A0A0L0GAA7_9EUKA|nr:hydroxymethylglutaryl-coenzyme A reductase [Sphaeroforma arctica JP610]KNC85967.1 hydroxymethylglutaryl-coenzyme A reductase [Sphaeroforma arctica JP610]|eukprot:XP_014159869.1 hydroxymethylglutaryl-coenzyme A reductase [Sphaeroforma arctica JP610]